MKMRVEIKSGKSHDTKLEKNIVKEPMSKNDT